MKISRITAIWPALMFVAAAAFYFYEFVLRVAPTAMYADLMVDFQISAASLGLLSGLWYFSYALLQVPIGAIMDLMGMRRLLTAACLVCALGALVFARAQSFEMAASMRLLIGAGSAFAFVGCMKAAATWFRPILFPIFAGLTLTLGNIGAVLGEGPVSHFVDIYGWRDFMWGTGVLGVITTLMIWLVLRDGTEPGLPVRPAVKEIAKPSGDLRGNLLKILCNRQNWWIALYGFFSTAPTDALGGLWGVPFLVQKHGFDHVVAGSAVSMTFVGIAVGSPIFGWLTNALGSRRRVMYMGAGVATAALSFLVLLPTLSNVAAFSLFFLFGFFGTYVLTFVAVRDVNRDGVVAGAIGFANMVSMIGSTLMQYLTGYLLDLHWDGTLQGGLPLYSEKAFTWGLAVYPLSYFVLFVFVIPRIKESFSEV